LLQDQERSVLLELGAGKGLLGRIAAELHPLCTTVLVDRRACSNANYDDDTDTNEGEPTRAGGSGNTVRVLSDLKDCNILSVLTKVCKGSSSDTTDRCKHVVICAKHLCACATDMALRRVREAHDTLAQNAASEKSSVRPDGEADRMLGAVMLAPCCHSQVCSSHKPL
jgi:hypothetical protein